MKVALGDPSHAPATPGLFVGASHGLARHVVSLGQGNPARSVASVPKFPQSTPRDTRDYADRCNNSPLCMYTEGVFLGPLFRCGARACVNRWNNVPLGRLREDSFFEFGVHVMATFVSLRAACRLSGLSQHGLQRCALLGEVRTEVRPGYPILFNVDDARAIGARRARRSTGEATA